MRAGQPPARFASERSSDEFLEDNCGWNCLGARSLEAIHTAACDLIIWRLAA